jgi:hypothetical protein
VVGIGGDTVMAVDFPNRRLNWVSASQGYLRSIPIDEQALASIIGGSGRSLSEGMVPFSDSLYAMPAQHGGYRDPGAYISYQIVDAAAKKSLPLGRISNYPSASPTDAIHVVDHDRRRMCIARGSVAEVSCIDASGARKIIRWADPAVPYTAEDRARYEAGARARVGSDPTAKAQVEKMLAERQWPKEHPRIHALQVDALGNLWIRETYQVDGRVSIRMRVIDVDGKHLAFANDVPMRGVGHWPEVIIDEDRLMRVYTDENDLPRIGVFRIRKTSNE